MSQCGRPGACSQAWQCPQGGHMEACGAVVSLCPGNLSLPPLCLGMTVRGWGGQGEDGVSSFNLGESVLEEKKKKKDVLGVLEVDLIQAEQEDIREVSTGSPLAWWPWLCHSENATCW